MYDRKCRNKKIGGYIIKRIRNRKNRQRVVRDSPAFYILIFMFLINEEQISWERANCSSLDFKNPGITEYPFL